MRLAVPLSKQVYLFYRQCIDSSQLLYLLNAIWKQKRPQTCEKSATREGLWLQRVGKRENKIKDSWSSLSSHWSHPISLHFDTRNQIAHLSNNKTTQQTEGCQQCTVYFCIELYGAFSHWRQGGHIVVAKQWNGGHVGVPRQPCRNWTLFLCKNFLLFQWISIDAGHVSENALLSCHSPKFRKSGLWVPRAHRFHPSPPASPNHCLRGRRARPPLRGRFGMSTDR